MILEGVTWLRNFVYIKSHLRAIEATENLNRDMPRIIVDLSLASRLALTICYVAMLMQGFTLMLLVLTFNYPILIMLCGGLSAGHFAFSFVPLPMLPI